MTTAALGPPLSRAGRARLAPMVRLSKAEVVMACQVLADADRCLADAGTAVERSALGDLFDLLEDRLTGGQPSSGEYSRESELTQ